MAISGETIGRLNEECQRIPLTDERVAELPIELGQLHAAVEAARPDHDFDRLARLLRASAARVEDH